MGVLVGSRSINSLYLVVCKIRVKCLLLWPQVPLIYWTDYNLLVNDRFEFGEFCVRYGELITSHRKDDSPLRFFRSLRLFVLSSLGYPSALPDLWISFRHPDTEGVNNFHLLCFSETETGMGLGLTWATSPVSGPGCRANDRWPRTLYNHYTGVHHCFFWPRHPVQKYLSWSQVTKGLSVLCATEGRSR